jgi:hypothetical protein
VDTKISSGEVFPEVVIHAAKCSKFRTDHKDRQMRGLTMRNNPIAGVMLSLLIVAALFCPVAYGGQSETLVEAARRNDLKQALDLIDKGVDANSKGKGVLSALMAASS